MDQIWAREAAQNPAMFDGPVVACISLQVDSSGRLVLSWAPVTYRYRVLRQIRSTGWKPAAVFVTVVQPVTGGGLVAGRQSGWTMHPGRWQLPGGSVEPPPTGHSLDLDELRRHGARELAEEIGLRADPDDLEPWAVSQGEHGNVGIHFVAPPQPEELVRQHHRSLLASLTSDVEPELEQIEVVDSPARLSALTPAADYLLPLLARWTAAGAQMASAPAEWRPANWPVALTTDRLRLRPVEAGDHPLLRALWSDPVVRRYLGGPVAADRIAQRLAKAPGRPGHFTVVLDEAPIGRVTVDQDHRAAGRTEVSYEFLPSVGGRGLAAEAVAEVLRWVRATDPARELVAVTQSANRRSRRLLERLGLSAAARLAEHGAEQVVYVLAPGESPLAPSRVFPL